MVDIFKAAVAIVAGGNKNLGTSCFGSKQLLRLDAVARDAF